MSWPYDARMAPRTPRSTLIAHVWLAVGIGLCFGLILFVIRAPVSRCVGFGVVAALASFPLLRSTEVRPVHWPPAPAGRVGKVAAAQRWRLNGFDALVDRTPGFSPHLRHRLQALATAQLAARQVVPGTPAARQLLGGQTHDLLFLPEPVDGRMPGDPDREELLALIDRLIELGGPPMPGHAVAVAPPRHVPDAQNGPR